MIHPPSSIIPPGFASHALQSLQRVQLGMSPIELIYTAHEHWPFRPGGNFITHARPTLHISVLDSSFNPPTLAHLALANSLPPLLSSQASTSHHSPVSPVPTNPCYDARLFLLSVRNADKLLQPGDAKLVQRLEMMRLLSYDVRPAVDSTGSSGKSARMNGNVAIAVIDEPTFVGKSTVLLRFLQARLAALIEAHSPGSILSGRQYTSYPLFPAPKLTFLLGFDTLIRLCSSKYYPSELDMVQLLRTFLSQDQEDCHIVCAYRGSASARKSFQEIQDGLDVAHQFITSGRIAFIDIGAEEQTYSSSDVRTKVVTGDGTWKRLVTNTVADYIIKQGLYLSMR